MPLGSDAAGGFGALGMIGMPLMIAAMILKQPPGPVAKLVAARAVSEDTARRLEKIGIPRPYVVDTAVRRGVVHRTSDGRYWVDIESNRRFRRKVAIMAGLTTLGAGVLVWWLVINTLGGVGGGS